MLIKKLFGLICLLFVTAGITFAQGTPSLSINDITAPEGDSTSTLVGWDFTISLSAPSTQVVSVTVSTQAGSAAGDVDFGAGSTIVNIPAGQTSQSLTVFIKTHARELQSEILPHCI